MPVNKNGKLPTLTMDHLKDYLQRNSSPKKKLSFNEILMGIVVEFSREDNKDISKDHMVYDTKFVDGSTKKAA